MKLNFSRLREKIQSQKSAKTEIFDLRPREGTDSILNRGKVAEKCSCIGCGVQRRGQVSGCVRAAEHFFGAPQFLAFFGPEFENAAPPKKIKSTFEINIF